MVKKVLSSEDITIPEALKLLEESISTFGSDDKVNEVLDYLRRFSKLNPDKAKELVSELVKRFGIARITAIQIVNIMPKYPEELKIILGLEKREFSDREIQEMLDLINSYRSSK